MKISLNMKIALLVTRPKWKVDYVIAHCCDTSTVVCAFGFRRDVCTDQLMFIDKVAKYNHWYFGHYHFNREISEKKTCLYQRIIQLK